MERRACSMPVYTYVSHSSVDGMYAIPSVTTQKSFDAAISYQARAGDIFLCTYPKCGTTWVQTALLGMKYGRPLAKNEKLDIMFPHLELDGIDAVENVEDPPRMIKTHLLFDMTPWNPQSKYICVVRNPKDCFASYFYHTIGFTYLYHYEDGKFDDFFELLIIGKVDFGDFFDFATRWWAMSNEKSNVLYVLYEDLKYDPHGEFLKIAQFLGDEWAEKVTKNGNELLDAIVNFTSFKNMSQRNYHTQRPAELPFFRKGVIGDWKNLLTKSQSERVDEKMEQSGKKYPGFNKLWDKYAEDLK
ncbi:sulfotransferase ssu-1-like [Styela clava]